MDYADKFQQMIAEYNAGSLNIERFFDELLKLAQSLTEEEKRGVAESLSEEELALFDLLTKPERSSQSTRRSASRRLYGTFWRR